MIADLDTLLTALYVELTDRIIPSRGFARSGPGRPPAVTDAELACLAVAQVLLRYDDERHWLRAAPKLIGHLFPRLLGQGEYNPRLRQLAPLTEAALRWLADATPGDRGAAAADGRHPGPLRHLRYHRQALRPVRIRRVRVLPQSLPLVLGLQAAADLHLRRHRHRVQPRQPQAARRAGPGPPDPGAAAREPARARQRRRHRQGPVRTGHRGLLRQPDDLRLTLIRPARKDEKQPRPFPNWLRQRVEAVIWTLKHQLGLERHGGRIPAGLWARIIQRLLALNAFIWHNWLIGAPVKRSLIAYDHV